MRDSEYQRLAWTDRFRQPTLRELRLGLEPDARSLFDAMHKYLVQLDGVKERLAWYGDCWQWSIEYRTRLSDDPLAVIVPSPTDLQLALPLEREFANAVPVKRMKRAIRDGLELAREPFDTRWGVWSITAVNLIDDLQDLIELKLRHLAKRAG